MPKAEEDLKEPEFMTVEELVKLLRVNRMTIYRILQRGDLPYYQIGKLKRFRRSDVEAFLARARRGAELQR